MAIRSSRADTIILCGAILVVALGLAVVALDHFGYWLYGTVRLAVGACVTLANLAILALAIPALTNGWSDDE